LRDENRKKYEASCFAIDCKRTVIEYYNVKGAFKHINSGAFRHVNNRRRVFSARGP